MTRGQTRCPACGHVSERCYRCDVCGADLAGSTTTTGREDA